MARLLVVLLGLLFLSHAAESGSVGVCYGTLGDNLPPPSHGVRLMKEHGIPMVKVYDTNPVMLRALANTGIKVEVTLPNQLIAAAASADPRYAEWWVRGNVLAFYPATLINSLSVGNEVFKSATELTPQLVPAMKNLYQALDRVGLADAVKVTTPLAMDAFNNTYPPSASVFRDDLAESVMRPMLEFLGQAGSYLSVNLFPYLAYDRSPESFSGLNYLLFRPNDGVADPGTNLTYYSLFDAQLDAVYHAMDKLLLSGGGGGKGSRKLLQQGSQGQVGVVVSETNDPPRPPRQKATQAALDKRPTATQGDVGSVENSKAYVGNLINRVVDGERVTGNRGTPYRPCDDIIVYIFALFNEDLKPVDERHFGLFYPDEKPVYDVDFHGCNDDPSWCVANSSVGDARLREETTFACCHGANCSAIKPGARCFAPDTTVAHASYAFNDYYQRNHRSSMACQFGGAASVVYSRAPKDPLQRRPTKRRFR